MQRGTSCHRLDLAGALFAYISQRQHALSGWGEAPLVLGSEQGRAPAREEAAAALALKPDLKGLEVE